LGIKSVLVTDETSLRDFLPRWRDQGGDVGTLFAQLSEDLGVPLSPSMPDTSIGYVAALMRRQATASERS
jgi:hypothetical protein